MTLDSYAAKSAPPLSDGWYARLFAPSRRRPILTAVFACAAEIDGCAREAREPAVARLKLAWWREEIDLLAGGEPRHPVTLALAEANAPVTAASELWLALIEAAEISVEPMPHLTATAWRAHCVDAGALHELLALSFGAGAAARGHARELGAAVTAARDLCFARREAARGRVTLPLELLASVGIDGEDLAAGWPQPAQDLIARMSAEARTQLDAALAAIAAIPATVRRQLQPCLVLAALQDARLVAFVTNDYAVDGDSVPPLTRLWTAWRAARHALRLD